MNIELINDEAFDLICKYIKIRNESNISQRELAKKNRHSTIYNRQNGEKYAFHVN